MTRRPTSVLLVLVLAGVLSVVASPSSRGFASSLAQDDGMVGDAAAVDQANEYLDRLAAIGFTGAVLVAHGDVVLLAEGYGWADPDRTDPIGPDTIFAIGSNTKPFTAAAILKLQDEGKLSVEDRIDRFLAAVPPDKRDITIHQLLSHSAGFDHSGIFDGDFEEVGRDEAVQRILASELLFPPGSESSYADADMILLAAIVELASGRSYEAYVRDELLTPAGMAHTGFRGDDPALQGKQQAIGIVGGEPAGAAADLPPVSWSLMGAGGMVSTVADLFRWHQAVAAGTILSPSAQRAYAAPHVPLGPNAFEGYGWVIAEPEPGHRVRASAGGTDEIGHVNVIDWWLDDDLVVIVSSANASYNAEDIVPAIENIVFGRPQNMPPAIVPVAPDVLRDYAGRYDLPEGGAIVVAAAEDRLLFSPEGNAGFAALFPPEAVAAGDEQSDAAATLSYLESGKEEQLDDWKRDQAADLGPFQGLTVVGTASPEGGGEAWTYVAFEFARGSVLTRWVVRPDGVLDAAEVPTEPPALMFLPQSPTTFASFALGRPDTITATFDRDANGEISLRLTTSAGRSLTALRRP